MRYKSYAKINAIAFIPAIFARPFIRFFVRSLARTCTRSTDIFRDLHRGKTRNAVHLEGGLTVKVRCPMKMQIVYSPLFNNPRPWILFYDDWMSLKTRQVLTGRI